MLFKITWLSVLMGVIFFRSSVYGDALLIESINGHVAYSLNGRSFPLDGLLNSIEAITEKNKDAPIAIIFEREIGLNIV